MKDEERDAAGCAIVLVAWVVIAWLIHLATNGGSQ